MFLQRFACHYDILKLKERTHLSDRCCHSDNGHLPSVSHRRWDEADLEGFPLSLEVLLAQPEWWLLVPLPNWSCFQSMLLQRFACHNEVVKPSEESNLSEHCCNSDNGYLSIASCQRQDVPDLEGFLFRLELFFSPPQWCLPVSLSKKWSSFQWMFLQRFAWHYEVLKWNEESNLSEGCSNSNNGHLPIASPPR